MSQVDTVRGPVPVDGLGTVLMHEHVFVLSEDLRRNCPELWREDHRTGLVAQEVLKREGVDLGAVVVGHSGDTTDLDYLHEVIDNGSYVGMDRFGLDVLLPSDERVATVAALAEQGYSDRMVLAQDASCHIDWFPPGVRETVTPNWHYAFIHTTVIPALKQAGVTDDQLTTMLVDNPRRYFSR